MEKNNEPNKQIMKLLKEHPEIEERRKEEERKTKERVKRIIGEFIPAIEASTADLLGAGKTSQGLSEMIQMGFNTFAQKVKLKDLGIIEHLDAFAKGDPMKESFFVEQKKLVIALGEWTVADAIFGLQWFGVESNKFTEQSIRHIQLSELLDKVKDALIKQDDEQAKIVSPIQPILDK